ncbi:MAG: hypothetical protein HY718_21970 [Planctomycetes bacterium]|nr:hypothetical protein [Planctomycetota bacterium]
MRSIGWALIVALAAAAAWAEDPDWSSMSYTLHKDYQAVDAAGNGTFPTHHALVMRGVLINWPATMLPTAAGFEPFLGGQWQECVQAVEEDDFGGTALWMGQYYGHLPFIGDPLNVYSDEEWRAELHRLNHDPATGRLFRPGDLVEIRARAPGLFHNGKTNINEQHTVDLEANFDVVLLQANHSSPAPLTITLADVKDDSDEFIFDATGITGAEHYQAALVRIENVQFMDGTWGPNRQMTIGDGSGRTLPLLLGLGSGFTLYGPPTGAFDVVGVFDQEDAIEADGFKTGYRLWAMDYDGSRFVLLRHVKPDFDHDGDVDNDDVAHFEQCALGPAIPQTDPGCLDADFNYDGSVDSIDFATFQRCRSGAEELADLFCDQ